MHSHQATSDNDSGDLFPYLSMIGQENKKLRKILFLSFLDGRRDLSSCFIPQIKVLLYSNKNAWYKSALSGALCLHIC